MSLRDACLEERRLPVELWVLLPAAGSGASLQWASPCRSSTRATRRSTRIRETWRGGGGGVVVFIVAASRLILRAAVSSVSVHLQNRTCV